MEHTRHRPSRIVAAAIASFALALTLSLTACDDDVDSGKAAGAPTEDAFSSTTPVDETDANENDDADSAADEPESTEPPVSALPPDIPDGFPDIGIPFYTPSEQVAGTGDADGMYVLEYVTDHELTIVNMFFRDALDGNGWSDVDRSVEGQMTINKTTGHGYSLVIAVGPERTDDTKTSIHYTLRPE